MTCTVLDSESMVVNEVPALMELPFELRKQTCVMKTKWRSSRSGTNIKQWTRPSSGAEEGLHIAEVFKQTHKTNNSCWKGRGKNIPNRTACTGKSRHG